MGAKKLVEEPNGTGVGNGHRTKKWSESPMDKNVTNDLCVFIKEWALSGIGFQQCRAIELTGSSNKASETKSTDWPPYEKAAYHVIIGHDNENKVANRVGFFYFNSLLFPSKVEYPRCFPAPFSASNANLFLPNYGVSHYGTISN